jgi:ATP-dependent DNA helicase RecQ
MIALLQDSSCLAAGLSEYFGETLTAPCGVCSACRRSEPLPLPEEKPPSLANLDFFKVTASLREKLPPPVSGVLITRFLCGIRTPKLSKARAGAMKSFGLLARHPYPEVLGWVNQHLSSADSPD